MIFRSMGYRLFRICTFLLLFTVIPIQKTSFSGEIKTKSVSENITNNNLQKDFYMIGPGDTLSIEFIGAPELSSNFQILSDGNIQLPLIGTQSISGLTLNEAKNRLLELFSEELIRPEINLNLLIMRPLKVSLVGEVSRPGIYSLNINETSQIVGASNTITLKGFPTLIDAIQKAGGVTLDSDISKITLYRALNSEKGNFKKVELDLLEMINTGNQIHNPNLFDGDVIKIPKLNIQNKGLVNVPNNLVPEKINIYVVGEVENPGMYEVSVNTNVNKAILIAGGPLNWRYQKNNIKLLRVQRNGDVAVHKLSYNNKNLVSKNKKTSLRNGDIIQINKNFFGKSSTALSTFLPPIRDMYSLYGVYKLIEE